MNVMQTKNQSTQSFSDDKRMIYEIYSAHNKGKRYAKDTLIQYWANDAQLEINV